MIEELIQAYDEALTQAWNTQPVSTLYPERALFNLLRRNKEHLPEVGDYFHKAFRQTDVIPHPGVDMAVWLLLQDAPIFWAVFDEVQAKGQRGQDDRRG